MFGPSPAFLRYVSRLLPDLGVRGVRQTTVTDWLLGQFSSRVTLSKRDSTFDDLMDNRSRVADAVIEAHLFKSGVKMRRLLDNYVGHLKRTARQRLGRSEGIRIVGNRGRIHLDVSPAKLNAWVGDAFKTHAEPNVARAYVVDILAEEWVRRHSRRGTPRSESTVEARRLVERSLDRIWPRIDFRTEYVHLLASADNIMSYSRRGDVDSRSAVAITQTAPPGAGQALGLTDLAAALYPRLQCLLAVQLLARTRTGRSSGTLAEG